MAEKEYIEREAAAAFAENCGAHFVAKRLMDKEAFPAADVRPVVREKWTMNSDFPDRLICSECGAQFDCWHWESKQMHFCPNCGADMRPTSMSGAKEES